MVSWQASELATDSCAASWCVVFNVCELQSGFVLELAWHTHTLLSQPFTTPAHPALDQQIQIPQIQECIDLNLAILYTVSQGKVAGNHVVIFA